MQRQTTCQKCNNRIPAGRRLCDTHRKSHRENVARRAAIAPMWSRILSPVAHGNPSPLITTADILALREKSLLSASGSEFEYAADLAAGWNAFLGERPIVLEWVTQ